MLLRILIHLVLVMAEKFDLTKLDNHLPPLLGQYKLVRLKHQFLVSLLKLSIIGMFFAFNQLNNCQLGRSYISVPVVVDNSGWYCVYKKCPSWKTGKAKRPRAYTSKYICE